MVGTPRRGVNPTPQAAGCNLIGRCDNHSCGWARILREVLRARLLAVAPVFGFGALVAVLAAAGELPPGEGVWAVVAVAAAFAPTGWLAPGGWRRRLAEASLLPVAYALTMLGDPTLRRFALPPLQVLAAWAAVAAALSRAPAQLAPLLAGAMGLSLRAAGGLGLAGYPWPLVLGALAASGAVPAALARRWGPHTGLAAALLVPWLPFAERPWLLPGAAAVVAAALLLPRLGEPLEPLAARWVPLAATAALVAAALAPWGGLPLERLFPAAGWLAGIGAVLALLAAGRFAPAVGGAAWLGAACLLGPVQPAPPDRAGVTLTAAQPTVTLPPGTGSIYLVDLALANASTLKDGTAVAELAVGSDSRTLRAGVDTAEWAHQRSDVRAEVAHSLPRWAVWRPHGEGRGALWGVGGRLVLEVPPGAAPQLRRAAELPSRTSLTVSTAGPSRPTPPRSWALPAWLAAAALAVALLQLVGGTWRAPVAAVPWVLLAAGAALARAPVEPLRLLVERHGVDLCLAALLAAWLPAARRWLARRRVFATAAALLVPLALATAQLHQGGGDEHYHLIVLRSLLQDGDLDLSNNYELERYPGNRIYITHHWLHSPLLAMLLAPGFFVAGRAGALALLALGGAALLAVLARLAASLRLPARSTAGMVVVALVSFPLATFASQLWTEIPGALAAAVATVLMLRPGPGFVIAAAVAILATGLKTRLALVSFPPLLAGVTSLWAKGRRRLPVALGILAALGAALALATAIYGHPLGPIRRFHHLLPTNLRQPTVSLFGLVFDCAGGLFFVAPLLLVALWGLGQLWRLGSAPIRGLIMGGAATLFFLLPSHEWYGGGSPPARYLVPALPVFLLALATLVATPSRVRRLAALALPPSVLVWCAFMTRPHLAFNPGDGGWWLGDALARRFAADSRALFPSFLVPTGATVWVPMAIVALVAAGYLVQRRWPDALRTLARLGVPLYLVGAAALVATLAWRTDRVVELEAAQVVRHGGSMEPPEGTFSRFLYRNGWRLGGGEGVTVPLRLPANAAVELVARGADLVEARWEGGGPVIVLLFSPTFERYPLPPPPGPGRQYLHLRTLGTGAVEVVLDRLEVHRP